MATLKNIKLNDLKINGHLDIQSDSRLVHELSDIEIVTKSSAEEVFKGKKVKKILSQGSYDVTAVWTEDDMIITWGNGRNGVGNTANYIYPTEMQFDPSLNGIAIRDAFHVSHSFYVLYENDELWVVGYNASGQLGINSTTEKSIPLLSSTSVARLIRPDNLTYHHDQFRVWIEKTDGSYWGTGHNSDGALGNNTTTNQLQWIDSGFNSLDSDLFNFGGNTGTTLISHETEGLYAAGYNSQGQLGDGTVTQRTTFTKVPALSSGLYKTIDNPNAYDTSASDNFSFRVDICEKYFISGAYLEDEVSDSASGKAYIFNAETGALLHTLNNPNNVDSTTGDQFGNAVAISNNYASVGAYLEDVSGDSSGTLYIFNSLTGTLLHTIQNPDAYGTLIDDRFAREVTMNDKYTAASSYNEDDAGGTDSGKVFIFDNITGVLFRTFDNPNVYGTSSGDYFGFSLDISDSKLIVGAYLEDYSGGLTSGVVYVFDIQTGTLLHTIQNPNEYDTPDYDNFGYSVGISNKYFVVGAYGEDEVGNSSSGKAYVYDVISGALLHTLNNPNVFGTSSADYFGRNVAISDTYCVVSSAYEDEDGADQSGVVYVFDPISGELLNTLNNPNAYDTAIGDLFGIQTAIHGRQLSVGTNYEDDAGGSSSGVAYIFDLNARVVKDISGYSGYYDSAANYSGSSAFITEDGSLYYAGDNGWGQLGINSTTDEHTATKHPELSKMTSSRHLGGLAICYIGDRYSSNIMGRHVTSLDKTSTYADGTVYLNAGHGGAENHIVNFDYDWGTSVSKTFPSSTKLTFDNSMFDLQLRHYWLSGDRVTVTLRFYDENSVYLGKFYYEKHTSSWSTTAADTYMYWYDETNTLNSTMNPADYAGTSYGNGALTGTVQFTDTGISVYPGTDLPTTHVPTVIRTHAFAGVFNLQSATQVTVEVHNMYSTYSDGAVECRIGEVGSFYDPYRTNGPKYYGMSGPTLVGLNYYVAGRNSDGILHDGSTTQRTALVMRKEGLDTKIWAFARGHTYSFRTSFFIFKNGRLYAGGNNPVGQLGIGTTADATTLTEVKIPDPERIIQIEQNGYGDVDFYHFLLDDGRLFATGYGGRNNIGDGKTMNAWVPRRIRI